MRGHPRHACRRHEDQDAEDDLDALSVGGVNFEAVTACERCAVTTFDQAPEDSTDLASKEPLRTLSRYRRRNNGYAGGVMFGTYIAPLKLGRISVGDQLT